MKYGPQRGLSERSIRRFIANENLSNKVATDDLNVLVAETIHQVFFNRFIFFSLLLLEEHEASTRNFHFSRSVFYLSSFRFGVCFIYLPFGSECVLVFVYPSRPFANSRIHKVARV